MRTQRFSVPVAAGPGDRAMIVVPFDPDEVWGTKAVHHVNGTVNGSRVRVTLSPSPDGGGWAFAFGPARALGLGLVVGDAVTVELTPEGPQRADLAEDIAAAFTANPEAGAFFDTLAQFYRKGYLRWIDATTRRPDVRAARIAEVVELCAAGKKERPRPLPVATVSVRTVIFGRAPRRHVPSRSARLPGTRPRPSGTGASSGRSRQRGR
jgi:hypothetical protein